MVLDDPSQVERLYQKLDNATLATAEVLKHRWIAKLGMYQLFRLDFIADREENVHLLESNAKPDLFPRLNPTFLPDMLRLVWTVTESLRTGESSETLKQKLGSFMDDTPFRILHIDEYETWRKN